ncbi:MAG: hypothetical protein WC005_08550 [Candidatus Nanopelagicales bacterium]
MSTTRKISAVVGMGLVFGSVVGLGLGVLWWRLAPRVEIAGDFQSKGFLASDVAFAALAFVAGILITIGLARMRREHLLQVLMAALLSSAVGTFAMWWVGHTLGSVEIDGLSGTLNQQDKAPLVLHMPAVLLVWPIAAALVVTVLALEDWLSGLRRR